MIGGENNKRLEVAYERLQRLYEVSKLLTRFEAAEQVLPNVIAEVSRTLPLRNSTFLLESETPGRPRVISWHQPGEPADRLRHATAHAIRMYRYLVASGADHADEEFVEGPAQEAGGKPMYIALPLVAAEHTIFGTLHLEGQDNFDETDLAFVNAVVNQVAVFVDRQANAEARERALDTMRSRAEIRREAAEVDRAEANVKRQAAELSEQDMRQQFAFARDVATSLGEGVIAVNLAERITLFNQAAERLCGCSSADALGKPISEVVQMRCPADTPPIFERSPFEKVMHLNQQQRSDACTFASSSRAEFPVSYTCAPLVHAGRVTGAVLAFRDIIGVKLAEQEQRMLADLGAALSTPFDSRHTLAAITRFAVPVLADLCFIDAKSADGSVQRLAVTFADAALGEQYASEVAGFAPRPDWRTPQARVLESGGS